MPEPMKPPKNAPAAEAPTSDPVAAAKAALEALTPEQRATLNLGAGPGGHIASAADVYTPEPPAPAPQVVYRLGEKEFQKFRPDGIVEVPFKLTHLQYVERRAEIERRSPNDMVQKIVREAMAADPTKAGLVSGGATGKRGNFNPVSGRWD